MEKIEMKRVEGRKAGKVVLFALSTCVWCRKTKKLLEDLGVAYEYVDVDLLEEDERECAERQIEKWNPSISFPTIVIDDKKCVKGFRPEELKEALGQ